LILGAVFKFLLSTIKVLGKNIEWFKTQTGKRVIKYSTIALGGAAGLMANLVFGMSWLEAAEIFVSGPLAVALHEYMSDVNPSDIPEAKKL
jgi:ADP-dependent phosphofructokinase/glucokinase